MVNYDNRGGLPAYHRGMFLVSLVSYAIFLAVSIGEIKILYKEFISPVKSKRNLIHSFIILLIIILVISLPKASNDDMKYGWTQADLSKSIDIKIEGRNYIVPIKYLDKTWKSGQNISHLGLVALLPKFEGRTLKNKHEFTAYKNGIGNRIKIYLDVTESINKDFLGIFGDLSNKALYLQYYKSQFNASDTYNRDTTVYGLSHVGDLRKKELYVSTKINDLTYYRCYKDPESGKRYFPTCETQFPLWGNVVIKYSFSKVYLKDWEEIHEGVIRLVGSFEKRV